MVSRLYGKVIREICRRGSALTQHLGFVLSPLHYYFPIPDTRQLLREQAWDKRTLLTGIDWNPQGQLALLRELAQYVDECNWPDSRSASPGQYTSDSASFGFTSTLFAHTMIRHFRPRRLIEIGVGWSTLAMLQAAELNSRDGSPYLDYTGIDPYPPEFLPGSIRARVQAKAVQKFPIEQFTALEKNDILFIDSSHVLNTGSDVQFLYLEVLPRLNPGVIVHIHDIQLPSEYPPEYALRQRWFWNEQYLLQAFLAFNAQFEILLAGHWLCTEHADELSASFPNYSPTKHSPTGSFWMRRRS